MKLKDYYRDYYDGYISQLAPSTQEGYRSSIGLHVLPKWGEWELHEIRVRHINAWLAGDFASPGQADKAYKCLRQIIRSAMGDEVYPDDVVDPTTRGVRKPRMPHRGEAPHLTARQTKELLLAVVGCEYEPSVICGVWLGLRRCEQCGLSGATSICARGWCTSGAACRGCRARWSSPRSRCTARRAPSCFREPPSSACARSSARGARGRLGKRQFGQLHGHVLRHRHFRSAVAIQYTRVLLSVLDALWTVIRNPVFDTFVTPDEKF